MTYLQIILLVLLVLACINAIIVTISPQTKRKKKGKEVEKITFNKNAYEKTSDKDKQNLINLYIQEIREKDQFNEEAFFKMPSLLKSFYLVDSFFDDMNYDDFLEFIVCTPKKMISETVISLGKIRAKQSKELLIRSIDILKKYGDTIESFQEKDGYSIHDIIVEPDFERNNKLIADFEKLDEEYHQNNENLQELNLAYFEKNKEELWKEIK